MAWGPHVVSIMVQERNKAVKHAVCTCVSVERVGDEALAHAYVASAKVWAHLKVCCVNLDKVFGGAAWRELAICVCSRAQVHIRHCHTMVPAHTALHPCLIAEVLHLQACKQALFFSGHFLQFTGPAC